MLNPETPTYASHSSTIQRQYDRESVTWMWCAYCNDILLAVINNAKSVSVQKNEKATADSFARNAKWSWQVANWNSLSASCVKLNSSSINCFKKYVLTELESGAM